MKPNAKTAPVDNSRAAIVKRLRAQVARGEPIIGGGAGTGISAKWEEIGGIDLIVIYNSGRYRMAGRGSMSGLMPYGNANQIVKEMAFEVIPVVKQTPVLAGVCGTDPFMMPKLFLRELKELGFAGIQNFPTVGLFDGNVRINFEETGISYKQEVEIVGLAREMEMLTTPYVFTDEETRWMAEAGADIIVAHMGTTIGGSIGAATVKTLDDCCREIDRMVEITKTINKNAFVLCHGGPIAEPPDAQYVIDHCPGVDGFYGASSMERLPTEIAIRTQTEKFKAIRRASPKGKRK